MRGHASLALVVAATLAVTSACLSGGDGADWPPAVPGDSTSAEPITLVTFGAPAARPLAPLVIRHPSIAADDDVTVRFEGGDVPVEVDGRSMADGEVMVLVPPLIDQATGALSTGNYEVSIAGAPAALIAVGAPARTTADPPGTFLREFVAQTADDLDASTPAFQWVADVSGQNGAQFRDSAQAVVADLRAAVAHFDEWGSFPVTTTEGPADLAGAELALADQLLSSYVFGLLDWLAPETGPSSFAGTGLRAAPTRASATPSLDIERGIKALRETMATIDDGSTIFTAIVGMSVTIGALLVKALAVKATAVALVATSTTILFGMLAVIGTGLVVGPAAEGAAAIEAHLQGGNSEFGPELWTRVSDAVADLGLTLGAEIHPVLNAAAFTYAGTKAIVAFHGLVCTKDDLPPRWIEWCNDQQEAVDAAAAAPLAIRRAWFRPHRIEPGDEGRLYVEIEPGPASPATAMIDWGDGSPATSVPDLDAGEIVVREHTFAPGDDGDRVVTISITVTDADGNLIAASVPVTVAGAAELALNLIRQPERLTTGQPASWDYEVVGGRPDYTITIDYGDNSQRRRGTLATDGEFTLQYRYDTPGQRTIHLDLTDADDLAASLDLAADVHDPMKVGQISGPAGLDVGEDGTWTILIEQGWPPFVVDVDWDDDAPSEPLTTENQQVELSRRFTGLGSYDIVVSVTDATGAQAEATTTLEVPRSDIVVQLSGEAECEVSDPGGTSWCVDDCQFWTEPIAGVTGTYDSVFGTIALSASSLRPFEILASVPGTGWINESGTEGVVDWSVNAEVSVEPGSATITAEVWIHTHVPVDDGQIRSCTEKLTSS